MLVYERVENPVARDALQLVRPPLLQLDLRPRDEIAHRSRYQDLAFPRRGHDPAAMWTAMPLTSTPLFSTSPVWIPLRTSRPIRRSSRRRAADARIARRGPSNVARTPSPIVLTIRPPNVEVTRCAASSWRLSSSRHSSSPN